jgi:putative ABC transport system permease protein
VKEIGIRIAAGASRRSLFHQFIAESVLFALIGALLAGLFVELIIHDFSDFSGIRIQALPYSAALLFLALIVLGSGVGLLSGLYPALYMSRLYPGWMYTSAARRKPVSKIPRNMLVVFQLCITLFLVFNTLVISRQLLLVNQYDTRINKEDLLIIQMRSPLMYNKYEVLKDELLSVGGVLDITASSGFLGNFQQRRGFYVEGYDRNDLWMLHHIAVACNYLDVMGTDLILGRDFRDHGDSNAVIINQALMRQAGWKNPLGRIITMPDGGSEYDFTVIGVVDDFHYASIHDPVESLLIFNNSGGVRYLAVRISAKGNVLRSVEEKWAGLYPDYPFDYFYQEEYLDDLYKEDRKMGSLFIYFTLLAIMISVLGLFGLVLFTSSRRTREIGIRKALGVDTTNLVFYLLKEYPVLLLISASISLPVAWYFAKRWLENFAVQASIGSLIFIISVILVAAVCLGTILYQTLRTARANPADALRYE